MKRMLSGMLALLLIFSITPAAYAEDELRHQSISVVQLEAMEYDQAAFSALVQEILTLTGEEANNSLVSEKLQELHDMFQLLNTKMELSSIASYRDVTTDTKEYMAYLDMYYDADALLGELVPTVLDSPCASSLDIEDSVFSGYIWGGGYESDDLHLIYEEEELIDQYCQDLNREYTVVYDGVIYTQESADDLWYNWELSDEAYDEISTELAKAQNDTLAPYYISLVNNRKLQVEGTGYRNVARFYDENYYSRDLTRKEREDMYAAVKSNIVPVLSALGESAYQSTEAAEPYQGQELLNVLRDSLSLISEDFSSAFGYMTEYGYYDIEPGENKMDGAFTTYLSYPDAPYLFMSPTETSYDFTTLVHEFGHYNAFYMSPAPETTNMDLAEIHSQALELLMLPHYDRVFGERADQQRLNTVYAIVAALVDGCMYDELERYAYDTDDLTVEDMNRKYMELLREYGYREDDADEAYGWVTNSHIFQYPMYYLSYGVSAIAALEIWERSLTDYEGAVDTYLSLVQLGESGLFSATLSQVGMEDVVSQEQIRHLAEGVSENFGLSLEWNDQEEIDHRGLILIGMVGGIWLIAAVLIMCRVIRKEKMRREKYGEYFYHGAAGAANRGRTDYWRVGNTSAAADREGRWREGGTADALPPTGESTVSAVEEDETTGSVC